MSVLFAALLGGFALGQAAPNIQFFAAAKVAGARVLGMINRSDTHTPHVSTKLCLSCVPPQHCSGIVHQDQKSL